jgi:hypothetical protein
MHIVFSRDLEPPIITHWVDDQPVFVEMWNERLIAYFENGFTRGWAFPVHESLRYCLGIHLKPQTIAVKGEDGKPVHDKDNKLVTTTFYPWFQEKNFYFNEEDVFYNLPKKYRKLLNPLPPDFLSIKVLAGDPVEINDKSELVSKGSVHFQIMRPSKNSSRLIKGRSFKTTQFGFVNYLKTGSINPQPILDFFPCLSEINQNNIKRYLYWVSTFSKLQVTHRIRFMKFSLQFTKIGFM